MIRVVTLLLLLAAAACSSGGDGSTAIVESVCEDPPETAPQPPAANQFVNGGFEDGAGPWCSLASDAWGAPFAVSDAQARGGEHSALLALDTEGDARQSVVFGVVTEVTPAELPEMLSGYYYIDDWVQGTPLQYVQAVVIVWGAANAPVDATNHQIRYVLAGIDSQPFDISNARYILPETSAIDQGRWVRFELPLREEFERLWGAVPEGFSRIRFLFEVRWDGRSITEGPSRADVYYDDLYLGPAAGSP